MKTYTKDEIQAIIDGIEGQEPHILPSVEGYSTVKVRKFLNRMVGLRPRTNYLEIGVHLGSTFIPAMHNHMYARGTAIDAWNMFGDLEKQFKQNVKTYLDARHIRVIHGDFREVDLAKVHQPVNVYFYDGDHGMDCQYAALTVVRDVLAQQFVFVVDDFNWQEPRDGTYKAIRDLGYTIEAEWYLPGPYNGVSPDGGENKEWWNGLFVGIIHK